VLSVCILALAAYHQLRHPQSVSAQPAADAVTLRVVFGYQRTASLRVTGGVLRGIAPWRFLEDDAIVGPDSWKLHNLAGGDCI
jgi:hypothetical protein